MDGSGNCIKSGEQTQKDKYLMVSPVWILKKNVCVSVCGWGVWEAARR